MLPGHSKCMNQGPEVRDGRRRTDLRQEEGIDENDFKIKWIWDVLYISPLNWVGN